ncbi:MAG: double-cubane-cluster-containing anaerobic reductase [Pseudomonadota bacterium]
MNSATLDKLQQISEQNLLDIEEAKKAGTRVIGFYCLYSPVELAEAAAAITLPLCGTRNDPISAAEEVLPRNLCPLIKSSYGFAATDTCPFFRLSDLIVADTTCDGKKKMFELLSRYKPVHVMQLPQNQDSETALPFWLAEVKRLKTVIEKETGNRITDEKLSDAIRLMNRERRAYKALMDLAKKRPSPISGMEMLTVKHKTGFFADRKARVVLLEAIVAEILQDAPEAGSPTGENRPRILLTGVPVGLGSEKVVRLIEESGGDVVCFENCGGYKKVQPVEENQDPLLAIAKRYLSIPCSVMSPNDGRTALLDELIREFSVDGVVDLTWHACHTYNIESHTIGAFVRDQHGLPFFHLETDYSTSDTEQLRVRLEAFFELMR